MKQIRVLDRQSLLDVAIQQSGSMEASLSLASANGLSLTDDLRAGEALTAVGEVDPETVARYAAEHICPATALNAEAQGLWQEGVGYWRVEEDLMVS